MGSPPCIATRRRGLGVEPNPEQDRIISPRPSRLGAASWAGRAVPRIYNQGVVRRFSSRLVLAFDADSVSAALVRRGLRTTRAVSLSSARLADGALVPSSLGRNLHDHEGVRQAVREASDSLGQGHPPVTLVLPHGVARLAVLEVP